MKQLKTYFVGDYRELSPGNPALRPILAVTMPGKAEICTAFFLQHLVISARVETDNPTEQRYFYAARLDEFIDLEVKKFISAVRDPDGTFWHIFEVTCNPENLVQQGFWVDTNMYKLLQ